jgi:anthranilate phosphoribosyltransferase
MDHALRIALTNLLESRDLTFEETRQAVSAIMEGNCHEVEIAALLTALRVKGEVVDELVGAAVAMHERVTPIRSSRTGLLDTCGTGGDELRTFNISTATAIVAAAAGVPVAKHGNRSVSSSSGSADVLEALGVNVQLSPDEVGRCIDELGIGFCFAPLLHGAMKHVAPVRSKLGFRTIFNMLGPLTNPAGAEYQLVGASRLDAAEKLARALARLGRKMALVVCGNNELDEVCLWGETRVFEVCGSHVSVQTWSPDAFGLPECRAEQLQVSSPAESAAVIQSVFRGAAGASREIVLANTAAALVAARHCTTLREGVAVAASTIDAGLAGDLCRRLAEFTSGGA